MTSQTGITWGWRRAPSVHVVRMYLNNYDILVQNPQCRAIMDAALVQFGRGNSFDTPTTLNSLLHCRRPRVHDLTYVFRWLLSYMLRTKQKYPFSDRELTSLAGVIDECRWARRYKVWLLQQYGAVLATAVSATPHSGAAVSAAPTAPSPNDCALVKACLEDPLLLYSKLEGPARIPTLVHSLPTKAMQLLLVHAQEIDNRTFSTEIRGCLERANGQFLIEPFLQEERPKSQFWDDFQVQYKLLPHSQVQQNENPKEETLAVDGAAATDGSAVSASPADVKWSADDKVLAARIASVLDSRVVFLTKDRRDEHLGFMRSLMSTEHPRQRFVGIYDVKNATLADVYEGQTVFQREPFLDQTDFTAFTAAWGNLAKPSVDLYWIACGRHQSSLDFAKQHIGKQGWQFRTFFLNYDFKTMERQYWKKCRGIANSHSLEPLLVCWKGKQPAGMVKERRYVDEGSSMCCEVMNNVPICTPVELAWVDKKVRERHWASLAASLAEPPDADAVAVDPGELPLGKKRRLYMQPTGTEQVWFPFEMTVKLSQELIWESGGDEVSLVLFGSPAAGNVVLGFALGVFSLSFALQPSSSMLTRCTGS